jgi:hypothetical protein
MPMNDNKPAYGNLTTGKVIPAHVVGSKNEGDFPEERLVPDRVGSLDPAEWAPGVVTADGKFCASFARKNANGRAHTVASFPRWKSTFFGSSPALVILGVIGIESRTTSIAPHLLAGRSHP